MPQHLMNHEERGINYPREEIGGGICLNERYIEGDGLPEKEARRRCLEQQWIQVLDVECKEARKRGEADHNLVTDAESRIAAHNKRVHKSQPALGAMYKGHVPKYKIVCEDYDDKYAMNDYELPYGKLQHVVIHNK